MENKKWVVGALLALVLVVGLCACRGGQVAPQIVEVEKPVVVEKEVPKIVEVEKPVIVEKEVLVEKVVTKTVPITITVPVTVEVPVEAEELTETEVVEAPQEVVVKVVVEHVGAPAWPAPVGVMVVPSTTHAIGAALGVSVTTRAAPVVAAPAQACVFNLWEPLRGKPGVTIQNDRTDWDSKANGNVSLVRIDGKATFEYTRWNEVKPGKWQPDSRDPYIVTWGSGEYDLQQIRYPDSERDLNDTLQKVTIHQGQVALYEHDRSDSHFPGIVITLTCPADPSS